jgi:hypothetical protein
MLSLNIIRNKLETAKPEDFISISKNNKIETKSFLNKKFSLSKKSSLETCQVTISKVLRAIEWEGGQLSEETKLHYTNQANAAKSLSVRKCKEIVQEGMDGKEAVTATITKLKLGALLEAQELMGKFIDACFDFHEKFGKEKWELINQKTMGGGNHEFIVLFKNTKCLEPDADKDIKENAICEIQSRAIINISEDFDSNMRSLESIDAEDRSEVARKAEDNRELMMQVVTKKDATSFLNSSAETAKEECKIIKSSIDFWKERGFSVDQAMTGIRASLDIGADEKGRLKAILSKFYDNKGISQEEGMCFNILCPPLST